MLSQKHKRPVDLAEALKAMSEGFLHKHDPVEKAQRAKADKGKESAATSCKGRVAIPAGIRHEVHLRDKGQCTFVHPQWGRCQNRRWLELDHIIPVSAGGVHKASNLTTLCSVHHSLKHAGPYRPAVARRV